MQSVLFFSCGRGSERERERGREREREIERERENERCGQGEAGGSLGQPAAGEAGKRESERDQPGMCMLAFMSRFVFICS